MWLMKTLLTSGCTNQRGAGHVPMVLRKTAWRLLNERYQRIKLNQAYRIENFLLVADFEYALEEHDELAE